MDIKMPDLDGWEVTKRARNQGITIPIIAQTAFAQDTDKTKSIEVGCNDYITKPINKDNLQKIIHTYLKK